jgi:hypothetical protein
MSGHGGGKSGTRLAGWPSLSNRGIGYPLDELNAICRSDLTAAIAAENKETIRMHINDLPNMSQPITNKVDQHFILELLFVRSVWGLAYWLLGYGLVRSLRSS